MLCGDANGTFAAGVASFGRHIGMSWERGGLDPATARIHGVAEQARRDRTGGPRRTWIAVHDNSGLSTISQEHLPEGTAITLTPWDPREIWPLLVVGLRARPAILCPFVDDSAEPVLDREALGLPPASAAIQGLYAMRCADPLAKRQGGTVVLQGRGVATVFLREVLPELDRRAVEMNVFYVASAELFLRLPRARRDEIFPERLARESIGITEFTLPTMLRWVRSEEGIRRSLHRYRGRRFPGSADARGLLEEAGLDAAGQLATILDHALAMESRADFGGPVDPRGFVPTVAPTTPPPDKVWLDCVSCGARIDPADYFRAEPLPTDSHCQMCGNRGPEECSNCRAAWLQARPGSRFRCAKCAGAKS
jgi:hypothetical protein